jgi:hypothetical protein
MPAAIKATAGSLFSSGMILEKATREASWMLTGTKPADMSLSPSIDNAPSGCPFDPSPG